MTGRRLTPLRIGLVAVLGLAGAAGAGAFLHPAGIPGVGAVAGFASPVIAALTGASGDAEPAAQAASAPITADADAPRITVEPARHDPMVETIVATGTLVAREEVLVGPEIDGLRIKEILVEEGDRVNEGQVLARLARETLEAQLAQSDAALARADAGIAQARSQISAARSSLTLATQELERAEQLLARGASTRAIIEQKTSAAALAKAQAQTAQDALLATQADRKSLLAQRRELTIRLEQTDIKAPKAGLVTRRTAKVGALAAAAGEPLFRIIADGEIELDAEIPDHRLPAVRPGQSAQIHLADGAEVPGRVRRIAPQIDPATRLGSIRIALTGNGRARIGSFARAVVEVRRNSSLTVPVSAILYDNGATRVQVDEDGVVRARIVRIGLIYDGRAEVLDGLQAGERVVVRAGAFLRDGDRIVPIVQEPEARR